MRVFENMFRIFQVHIFRFMTLNFNFGKLKKNIEILKILINRIFSTNNSHIKYY